MKKIAKVFSSDRNNRVALAAVLLFGFAMMALRLSLTYITDETGTMSNAAYLAGYDWSVFVENTGSYYYKYGPALFWYPVFALVKDSFWIYRLIMLESAVLLTLSGLCIYQILRKHLKVEDPFQALVFSVIAAITPPAVLYSLFARSDVMLATFSVYVLYFLMEAWHSRKDGKKQALYTFLSVLCTVYIFMSHSRGIVWVIAVTMLVIAMQIFSKERMVNWWVYIGSLVALMGVDKLLAEFFKEKIWKGNPRHASAESFDFSQLKEIFTGNGIKTMIKLFLGWCYNFMTSSMGIALAGIFAAAVVLWLFVRKKKNVKPQEAILSGYALLVFAGSVALGMLFFFPKVSQNYYGGVTKRVDRLVYDRYLAGSVVIAVLAGLYFFIYRKDIFQKASRILLACTSFFLLLFFKKFIAIYLDNHEFSARNSIASNLFLKNSISGHDAGKFANMSGAMFYAGIFAVAVLAVFLVVGWYSFKKSILGGMLAVFAISLLVNYGKMRLACDTNVMGKVGHLNGYVKEIREISKENRCIYIDKSANRHKPLQLVFKEFDVYLRGHLPGEEIKNYFIIAKKDGFHKKISREDCYMLSDFDYGYDYVIYVKGEGLKEELEGMGKSLVPLD